MESRFVIIKFLESFLVEDTLKEVGQLYAKTVCLCGSKENAEKIAALLNANSEGF